MVGRDTREEADSGQQNLLHNVGPGIAFGSNSAGSPHRPFPRQPQQALYQTQWRLFGPGYMHW
jgi:hypothetical protein